MLAMYVAECHLWQYYNSCTSESAYAIYHDIITCQTTHVLRVLHFSACILKSIGLVFRSIFILSSSSLGRVRCCRRHCGFTVDTKSKWYANSVILYTKTMLGNFLRFLSVGRICVSGVLSNILGDHAHYPSPLAISTLYSPGPTFNILNQSA